MAEIKKEIIFEMFDRYLVFLECPSACKKININNVKKIFDCSRFIETTIARLKNEGNTINFEEHLHGHWSEQKRTKLYTCKEFEFASDKLLQVLMKNSDISTPIVDKYLNLYVENFSRKRLNNFLDNLLTNSLLNNSLLKSLVDCGLDKEKFDNDIRLAEWRDCVSRGKYDEVSECIDQMINNGQINTIFNYTQELEQDNPLKKLILQTIMKRTDENNTEICLLISQLSDELLTIICDDYDFRNSFVDAIFYFGRNMDKNGDRWIASHGFSYDNLVKIIKKMLNLSDDIVELVERRLRLAKMHTNNEIWKSVDKDISQ